MPQRVNSINQEKRSWFL